MTGLYVLLALVPFTFMAACATTVKPPPRPTIQEKAPVPQKRPTPKPSAAELPPLAEVKPKVAAAVKMPYEGRVFSLSARNAPLQDVVMGLAKEAGLNLIIEKGVDPMEPVSVEIANVSLEKALDVLFSAYDYFYSLEANILRVKALETRFFKFEYPIFSNTPQSTVGGDVLGGAGGGGAALSGEFTVDAEGDEEALNIWDRIKDALQPAREGGAEGGLLSEMGRAQVNVMTGTIVVTDRREKLDLVEEFLSRLRGTLRRQVVIEARILEVTLNDEHQFGIDWSYISGDFTFTQAVTTGAAGAFNIGVVPTAAQGSRWFLEALSTQGDVNVLSSPRVNVLNNQSAVLTVGRTIPYLEWNVQATTTAAGTTAYTAVPQVARAQAGISLGVTPQIGEDGVVTLHIVPIITDFVSFMTFTFEGNNFDVPVIDVRGTDSVIRAPDGYTVIIAGLIQERSSDTVTGIPGLKDIPLLGALFSQHRRTKTKVELVITLTPTIVEP